MDYIASRKLHGAFWDRFEQILDANARLQMQSAKPDLNCKIQIGLADRNFWVAHQQRLRLDLVWSIDRSVDRSKSFQSAKQKRFEIQLRIAKLQINKLALSELHIRFVLRHSGRVKYGNAPAITYLQVTQLGTLQVLRCKFANTHIPSLITALPNHCLNPFSLSTASLLFQQEFAFL